MQNMFTRPSQSNPPSLSISQLMAERRSGREGRAAAKPKTARPTVCCRRRRRRRQCPITPSFLPSSRSNAGRVGTTRQLHNVVVVSAPPHLPRYSLRTKSGKCCWRPFNRSCSHTAHLRALSRPSLVPVEEGKKRRRSDG